MEYNGLYQIITYQQHFFLSFSFFFWVSFLVGTSTGMKLLYHRNTFILACFTQKPRRFSRRWLRYPLGSLHLCSNGRSWDAFAKTSSQLLPQLIFQIIYRFCCPQEWKEIFQVLWELLDSWIRWSKIRCYRKTKIIWDVPFCWWYHTPRHSNLPHDKKRHPNSWTFPDRRCPISKYCIGKYF